MIAKQLLVPFTILFCAWISLSCDCIMTPIKEHIKNTDFIVGGKVVELLDSENDREQYVSTDPECSYRIKLKLVKCYKGGLSKDQIILIDSDYTNCSIYFKLDSKYLLFLDKSEGKNEFRQRTCSYSEKWGNAGKYVKAINKQMKNKQSK